jgi:hypothetical protein
MLFFNLIYESQFSRYNTVVGCDDPNTRSAISIDYFPNCCASSIRPNDFKHDALLLSVNATVE